MPIAVSLPIQFQALGILAYTHVPQCSQCLPTTIFQAPAFPVTAVLCSTALIINIAPISQASHIHHVIVAKGIEAHISRASGLVSSHVVRLGD